VSRAGPFTNSTGTGVQDEVQPHSWWGSLGICSSLVLAVWAVFGQTLHYEFVNYDDRIYVYENPDVIRGLSLSGVVWAFTHTLCWNWHPITALSHMLDYQLYGLNAGGHHLTNILLHSSAAMLLFLLLQNLTGAVWKSAFVAGIFAIHPLRVESVAWVAERKDVLSGLFFMLTLWAYTQYAKRTAKGGVETQQREQTRLPFVLGPMASGYYWLALVFCALGLMSKPMLVTLPFVMLLLDYWPLQRFPKQDSGFKTAWFVWEKIPFLIQSAAVCVATVLAQQTVITLQSFSVPSRLGNALVAYAAYIGQSFYPVGLGVLYPHPGNRLSALGIGLSLMMLLVITVGVVAGRREYRWMLVGWLWYLGMLVPVIGLVQVGAQARADRYTYLPQIGLCILLVWGTEKLYGARRYRHAGLAAGGVAILGVLLVLSRAQTVHWKDSVSLWTHTLACTSENYIAHYNLGVALSDQGKTDEAIQQYEQALQIKPDYTEAHNNLGLKLNEQGKFDEAIQHYEQLLQIKPDFAEGHFNLGLALDAQGKLDKAIQQYERTLQIKPDHAKAHNNLGVALKAQGKVDKAIQHYDQALQIKPDFAEAHFNLGVELDAQGKLDEAVRHYERALQIKPDYTKAHNALGITLAKQGKLEEAIHHFEQALRFKPDYAEAYLNIGHVLTIQGKLTEAIPHLQQALTLATAQNNPALAETIRNQLRVCLSSLDQTRKP